MAFRSLFILLLLSALAATRVTAQVPAGDSLMPIKVFINCRGAECFSDFLKTELSFFGIVRDMAQSDIQVFILQQETAAGGSIYTLEAIGQRTFTGLKDSTTVVTEAMDTDAQERAKLLAGIQNVLAPFVMRSPWRSSMAVTYNAGSDALLVIPHDPWRNWVATLGTSGNIDGESNRKTVQVNSYLNLSRITTTHKFLMNGWYNTSRTRITLDSSEVKVNVSSGGIRPYYAHALNSHWSIGPFGSLWYDQYSNIRLHYRLAAAIEYNVFPHSENTRRQLRIGYQTGYRHFYYYDTTVFNKLDEQRIYQQAAIVAAFAQPWGTIDGLLEYKSYWDNLRQNRLTGRLNMSVRILQGLNVDIGGSCSVVNDQISLSKLAASEEQLLLRGSQLPTDVLYSVYAGFSFTFGSTNNSIVNPRFNEIDN